MIPEIFSVGPFPVNSFGLCVALGLFAAILSVQRSLFRYGADYKQAENMVFVAGISGVIGARLLHLIEIFDGFTPEFWQAAIAPAGFTFYGGFILATICVALFALRQKMPLPIAAGVAAPAVALGYAIGRLGCQLSGDGDYGISTESILGMSYGTGYVPTPPGVLAYPTPLYESFLCLVIAWLFFRLEEQPAWRQRPLKIFGLGVLLLAVERFSIEFLRINPDLVGTLSQAQLIAIAIAILSTVIIVFAPKAKELRARN